VEEIELTPPPLETLIERYEEGMLLLKTCREKLNSAEKRIEIITRAGSGETLLEPFPKATVANERASLLMAKTNLLPPFSIRSRVLPI